MLQITLSTFAKKVEEMRNAQKKYYQSIRAGSPYSKKLLIKAKELEKETDDQVKKILLQNEPSQASMF